VTEGPQSDRERTPPTLHYGRTGHGRLPQPRGSDSLGGVAGRVVVCVIIVLVGINAVAFFMTPVTNPWQRLWMIVTGLILLAIAILFFVGMRRGK
jgi:hypothetical protein